MLYLVEINFSDPVSEPEWDAWYQGHLKSMVTVPGIQTAQRFRATGSASHRYLAAYCAESLAVFSTDAYRDNGGAGRASLKWKAHISRRRVLYSGVDWLPEVSGAARLLLTGDMPAAPDLKDVLFSPLSRVGLDGFEGTRHVSVASLDVLKSADLDSIAVYEPRSVRHVAGVA